MRAMSSDLSKLTDAQCVALLRLMARRWLEHSGVQAFTAYQKFQQEVQARTLALPAWLEAAPGSPPAELVQASRAALQAIADGEDENAKAWLNAELADMDAAQGHMFDPISLAILGATLIGCILAARVKKIGSVEFYEGVPPELAKVIKAAAPSLTK
jgi:hypothetical protein